MVKRCFMYNIFVRFRVTLAVCDVPSKRFKEWIDELAPDPRLFVISSAIMTEIPLEALDQLDHRGWCRHCRRTAQGRIKSGRRPTSAHRGTIMCAGSVQKRKVFVFKAGGDERIDEEKKEKLRID